MQGTVSEFDPSTRTGSLLLDDGSPMTFGAVAFGLSGLRLLRLGQRVQIELSANGDVDKISIPTF